MKRFLTLLIVTAYVVAIFSLPATQDDHDKQMKKDEQFNTNVKPTIMAETVKGDDDKLKYHHTSDMEKLHKRDVPIPIEPKPKPDDEESKESNKPKPQVEDLSGIVYGDKSNSQIKQPTAE